VTTGVPWNANPLRAVPFFLLSANIMNSAGITDRLVDLAKCLVGRPMLNP
jgi:TRAP-type C4-dicarboxylate transport system permease large subunit